MRLNYFLKGVGTGVIVTTLILTISGNVSHKLSDSEVIERALELGMIPKETVDDSGSIIFETSSSILESTSQKDMPEETTGEETMGAEETSSVEDTAAEETSSVEDTTAAEEITTEETISQIVTAEETTAEEIATEKTAAEEITSVPKETSQTETAGNSQPDSYTLQIISGMNSYQVAVLLETSGVIASAQEFDYFMERTGNAEHIVTGEFELSSDMSYETIAKVITTIR